MVIDQGADQGLRAGQTLTIYRPAPGRRGPLNTMTGYGASGPAPADAGLSLRVGTARVLSVQPHTALVRIESTREAVYIGDFAAVHRSTQ
jgi:hypothetical protein